jgi:hypothetical protein
MKKIDLTGKIFNKLKVIGLDYTKNSKLYWKVECECGKQKTVRGSSLKSGDTTSCGSGTCVGRVNDITGMTFGKLKVIKFIEIKDGRAIFLCQCECGKTSEVEGHRLLAGSTVTCTKCSTNIFYRRDDYMIGITPKSEEFIFDIQDFAEVSKYNWWISNGYVVSKVKNKTLKLHNLIMNPPEGLVVDHKNGNPLDNKQLNLRICTQHENTLNSKNRSNSSIKYKGVDKRNNGKYRARIMIDGKREHIGDFDTGIEAALAYNEKAKELFGEFARLNEIKNENSQ